MGKLADLAKVIDKAVQMLPDTGTDVIKSVATGRQATILCSAGKGELTVAACLDCSLVDHQSPCGFDYSLLKSLLEDSNTESRRNDVHVTDLTGCLRKAWYSKVMPAPEFVHERLARWLGTAVHAHVEGSDDYLDSELPIGVDGLVGTADIVYKDGTIVDFKTTRWMYPEKLPYGSHELQVNVYAWMLRQMGRMVNKLFIQYIDMSGPTKCRKCRVTVQMQDGIIRCPQCLQVPKSAHLGAVTVEVALMDDNQVGAYIKERKEALEASLMFGIEPDREVGFLCGYCGSRPVCRPEITEE